MSLASEETLLLVKAALVALQADVADGITATVDTSTLATGAKQDTGNTALANINTGVANLRKYKGAVAVTPNDGSNLAVEAAGLFVGTGGTTLKIRTYAADGTTPADVIFTNVPNGTTLPLPVIKVYDTDTDAEDLVAVY